MISCLAVLFFSINWKKDEIDSFFLEFCNTLYKMMNSNLEFLILLFYYVMIVCVQKKRNYTHG